MLTTEVGLSPRAFAAVLMKIDAPEDIWWLHRDELEAMATFSADELERLIDAQSRQAEFLDRIGDWIAAGYRILRCDSAQYPKPLLTLPDAPPCLFARGRAPEAGRSVFLTGSQKADTETIGLAVSCGKTLAALDVVLISTLATGAEAGGHVGALSACGHHLVFLAGGHEAGEAEELNPLMEQLLQEGAVFSEFSPYIPHTEALRTEAVRLAVACADAVLLPDVAIDDAYLQTVTEMAMLDGKPVFYLVSSATDLPLSLRSAGAYSVADPEHLDLILPYL